MVNKHLNMYLFVSNLLIVMQGLQRFCTEHKIKLSKVSDFFFFKKRDTNTHIHIHNQMLMILLILNKNMTSDIFQIDHIFLSRVCSETAGGIPGLYLYRLTRILYFEFLFYFFSVTTIYITIYYCH